MPKAVFYSHQSGLPRAANLDFLEAVLAEAIDNVGAEGAR